MSYQARNRREPGGSTWTISGDLNVPSTGTINIETGGQLNVESGGTVDVESGGTIDFESGGYEKRTLSSPTTHATPLVIGAMNHLGAGGTTGMYFTLPVPVAGARLWAYSTDATTGSHVIMVTTGYAIGCSTEAGAFADANRAVSCTGVMLEFLGISSSQWYITSNPGSAKCSAYSTALWSTD